MGMLAITIVPKGHKGKKGTTEMAISELKMPPAKGAKKRRTPDDELDALFGGEGEDDLDLELEEDADADADISAELADFTDAELEAELNRRRKRKPAASDEDGMEDEEY